MACAGTEKLGLEKFQSSDWKRIEEIYFPGKANARLASTIGYIIVATPPTNRMVANPQAHCGQTFRDVLDEFPGIGERANGVLKKLGSVRRLQFRR